MNVANGVAGLPVGRRRHRAGVQYHHIGAPMGFFERVAAREQLLLDGCRVRLGRTAAEILDGKRRHKLPIATGS
jgi:hypothetical protein